MLQIVESLSIVPTQYFKKLDGTDGIWEVRVDVAGIAIRLLGFVHNGALVIVTNGFSKKTQKTPASEIALAEKRKKDHLLRGTK